MTAVPAPIMKINANRSQGPSRPIVASTASSSPAAVIQIWAAMSVSRRSRMSANAPPGSAKRNTGSMLAACTKLTMTGEGASEVMSHPAPVFCTHSPVLLASVAIQSARKARWRSGAKAVAGVSGPALRSALKLICVFSLRETVHADIYELACLIGPAAINRLKFLTGQLIVMRKEGLDLVKQLGTQVMQSCEMRMTTTAGCDREEPIVLDPFAFPFPLPCLDDPEQPGGEDATNRSRGVQQHEDIQRISVVAEGGRNKAEVEREGHSFRQYSREAKRAIAAVVIVFVGTSFRGFDHHREVARFRMEGRKVRKQCDQARGRHCDQTHRKPKCNPL